MEKELIDGQMNECTSVNLIITKCMAEESLPGPMEDHTKDNITKIKSKAKEFTLGQTGDVMMAIG